MVVTSLQRASILSRETSMDFKGISYPKHTPAAEDVEAVQGEDKQ